MRLPIGLYMYIGRELLRLFALTVFVLVWVIAFGAAIKPISEGQLSIVDTMRYVTLAVVPMLQFASPFAAGFAATLTYHRLAADNELLACTASGFSYRAVVAPVVILGVVLAGALLLLSHAAVPSVMIRMERMLQADIGTFLVSAINRGEGVRIEGWTVYADEAYRFGADETSGARERIVLLGVAAGEIHRREPNPDIFTARQAEIYLYDKGDDTVVQMALIDTAARQGGNFVRSPESSRLGPWLVPSVLRRDPKFETWSGLAAVHDDPDLYPAIRDVSLTLAEAIARWRILRAFDAGLRQYGMVHLVDPEQDYRWTVEGTRLQWQKPYPRVAPGAESSVILVRRHAGNGDVMEHQAPIVGVEPDHYSRHGAGPMRGAYFNLHLSGGVVVRNLSDQGEVNEFNQRDFFGLHLRNDPSPELFAMSSEELIVEAKREQYRDDEFIQPQARALRERIEHLRREIDSKYHERAAMSISCMVMLFAGAMMAVRLRHTLPLVVYLWSFLPALGTIILISSGQQVMEAQNILGGAAVMWSGVAVLGLIGLAVYFQVRRH
ncbi:MAG: LptF/LptG family permease [Phycisphaerales bacterium]|nr:LptF/LptG family permease [Phycisphaerales bacterium]